MTSSRDLTTPTTAYDSLPYPTRAQPTAHPLRLSALGYLHGIRSASPQRARILELGCGTGGHLLPLALTYPSANIKGIDLSTMQIERANTAAARQHLSNVSFEARRIEDFEAAPDEVFDYIICHGVFSWVPESTRQKILQIIRTALAPNGIAYCSFNTLPGWRMRGTLRDIMQFGAALSFSKTPIDELQRACEFLGLVSRTRTQPAEPFDLFLRNAIDRLQHSDLAYLYHEYLEAENEPMLLTEFVNAAGQHDLSFVTGAVVPWNFPDDLPGEARTFLSRPDFDAVRRLQAMDYFRNAAFREVLLTHREAGSWGEPDLGRLANLFVSTQIRQISPDRAAEFIDHATGRRLLFEHPDEVALLVEIAHAGPNGTAVHDLLSSGSMATLQSLWRIGAVEAHTEPFASARLRGEETPVTPMPYWQEIDGASFRMTSTRHHTVDLAPVEQRYVAACDGHRLPSQVGELLLSEFSREEVERAASRLDALGCFVARLHS
jgi:SAM-dependent methyltransferase